MGCEDSVVRVCNGYVCSGFGSFGIISMLLCFFVGLCIFMRLLS